MRSITLKNVEDFERYLHEEEKSFNTIEKYLRDIRCFVKFIGNFNVEKPVVIEYKKYLCEEYAPKSVNSMLSSLNAFFTFMGWYDLKVKTLKIQRRIFIDKEKELTKPEYDRLLNCAKSRGNEKLWLLMQTLGSTGIRISELRFITVKAIKKQIVSIKCKGKLRTIFLPGALCAQLGKYAKKMKIEAGPLFIKKKGKPLDRSSIWKMMKALCDDANVSKLKVFPHNFRHLFARTFYSIEKDIVRLADLLGHSNIETTRIYTMESGDVHRMLIQKLGLLQM